MGFPQAAVDAVAYALKHPARHSFVGHRSGSCSVCLGGLMYHYHRFVGTVGVADRCQVCFEPERAKAHEKYAGAEA